MSDLILGIFFADHNNIVHENVKLGQNITKVSSPKRKLLPLKFFGPLFLSSASEKTSSWKIDLVEGILADQDSNLDQYNIIQSFFILNSSVSYENAPTHLSVLIGSPYTEDIDYLYTKIKKYIHPSIIQNKIVNESIYAGEFEYEKFIKKELLRGINLLEFSLGSTRKLHWHEEKSYYCIGLIERIKSDKEKSTYLYTFDTDSKIRKSVLDFIPSYYLISILPSYYENLMEEALIIFNKTHIYPNIAKISLKNKQKEVLYLEEYQFKDNIKRNLGVILIVQRDGFNFDSHPLMFYKKKLRQIFDKDKDFAKTIIEINREINPFKKWKTDTEENLKEIQDKLDN